MRKDCEGKKMEAVPENVRELARRIMMKKHSRKTLDALCESISKGCVDYSCNGVQDFDLLVREVSPGRDDPARN